MVVKTKRHYANELYTLSPVRSLISTIAPARSFNSSTAQLVHGECVHVNQPFDGGDSVSFRVLCFENMLLFS